MASDLLLGIDLGTSRSKVLAMAPSGEELALVALDTPWRRVPSGAEMAAIDLLASVVPAMGEARARAGGGRVLAIGITAIGQSGLLVDAGGQACTPIAIWHDTRAASEASALAGDIGPRRFAAITGLAPSPYFAPSMVRWHLQHTTGAEAGVRWLGMGEWLAYALGAAPVAERSLAAQSGFLDVFGDRWSDDLVRWTGRTAALMPPLVTAGEALGRVSRRFPAAEGAVLTVAGHDHLCGAVGVLAGPRTLYDSCGTAETMLQGVRSVDDVDAAVDAVLDAGLMFGRHVLPDTMCVSGSIPTGRFLGGVLEALGVPATTAGDLDDAALAIPDPGGWEALRVRNDGIPSVAALGAGAEPAVVWRRAVEAAVAEAGRVAAALAQFAGAPEDWVVGGGWTRNRALLERKRASVRELRVAAVDEPGARGAALLAGRAAGLDPDARVFEGPRTV